jgi:hypothetical protein
MFGQFKGGNINSFLKKTKMDVFTRYIDGPTYKIKNMRSTNGKTKMGEAD